MKISFITVVFNAVETIEDTLKSVIEQDHDDIEHLIIDGASTDGTMDIIDRYRDNLAGVISEPDQGIYDAMNKGIELASGEVIGTLNADDWYADSGVLSRVARAFTEEKNLDAVYGDIVYVSRDDPDKIVRYWVSGPYREGLFKQGWMPAHPSFFVKKDIYHRYGKFDLEYKIQSDFELTMRFIAVNKINTRYLPGVMVKMRMGGVTNSRISNIIKGNLESYRASKKHGIAATPFFIIRKVLSRLPQFFHKPENLP